METRRVRRHGTTAVFLAFALLLAGGAAAVAAAPDLFPASGQTGGPNAARGVEGGDIVTLNIPLGGLAPGVAIRGRHLVENMSGQPLRYALSSSSVNSDGKSLRDIVRVTIRTADSSSGPAASCDSFDGATLYSGRLGARSAGFGDPRIGGHAGDRVLAAGQREALCYELEMPLDAGNEFQGAVTASVWTIATEQVAGNS
jgi:hypothetical protein